MKYRLPLSATALAALALVPVAPIIAQESAEATPVASQDEPAATTSAVEADMTPEQARAALNAEQAKRAAEQVAQNEASAAAEAEYKAKMEAYAAQHAAYEKAVAEWKANVAACQAGDVSRCAPTQ
ncbi:MAG: hypothetical protein KDE63_02720 [Novosphingobium sp.]|nr:hypothetical protein [Novosphingobium sp.]